MNLLKKLFAVFVPDIGLKRSFFTLFKSNFLLQVLTVAPYPVLTRLYSPEDFSTFALYTSLILVVTVFITARYDAAIVIAKSEEEATNLIQLSSLIALCISIFLLFPIVLFPGELEAVTVPVVYLYSLPAVVFCAALIQIGRSYYNRKSHYQGYARNQLLQRGSSVGVTIAAGFKHTAFNGLIGGSIVSFVLAGLAMAVSLLHFFKSRLSLKALKSVAVTYRDFPAYSMPLALLNLLSAQLPLYVIYRFFDKELAGHYAMATRFLSIPESIVSASIAVIFYREFSKVVQNRTEALKMVTSIWKRQFLIGIIPFILVLFFGEDAIAFILGEKWRLTGQLIVLLSVVFYLKYISIPTGSVFAVLRKQPISFIFGCTSIIIRIVMLSIGYYYQDLFIALKIFVCLEMLQTIIFNIVLYKNLKNL